MERILIAIADDEALFRRGLRLLMEDYSNLKVILEAEDGVDLMNKIRSAVDLPDVLLLDLKMPNMSGVEVAKVFRVEFPSIHIITISSHISKSFILNMIEIGAAACLGKNAHPEEVVDTIQTVREKGFCYSPYVMEVIRENMFSKQQPKLTDRFDIEITAREREILQLICEQFTTQEIASKLFISDRTVDGHRNNLLSKLGCRNTAGLVVYALQHELVKI